MRLRRKNCRDRMIVFVLALLLASLPVGAKAADALYNALLKSRPQHLPAGFSVAQVRAGPIDQDDRNAGLMGNVEMRLQGSDPKARIHYLLFPDEAAADAYLNQFDAALTAHKATWVFLASPPQARCGETPDNAGCAVGAGRVAVFALGTRVQGSVGPLLDAALDHLNAVKKVNGLQ